MRRAAWFAQSHVLDHELNHLRDVGMGAYSKEEEAERPTTPTSVEESSVASGSHDLDAFFADDTTTPSKRRTATASRLARRLADALQLDERHRPGFGGEEAPGSKSPTRSSRRSHDDGRDVPTPHDNAMPRAVTAAAPHFARSAAESPVPSPRMNSPRKPRWPLTPSPPASSTRSSSRPPTRRLFVSGQPLDE